MRSIRFLTDYRGVLTDEKYYQVGSVVFVDIDNAAHLVAEGRAEYIPNISQGISQPKPGVPDVDIEGLNVGQLKKMARLAGISGYRKMKKAQLVDELRTD